MGVAAGPGTSAAGPVADLLKLDSKLLHHRTGGEIELPGGAVEAAAGIVGVRHGE